MSRRPVDPRFIGVMEDKLQEGRDKGKKSWDNNWEGSKTGPHRLFGFLLGEVQELQEALYDHKSTPEDIAKEAADVANFAMMIADRSGGLK